MNNKVNMCSYLGFLDNNMYTADPNNYFSLTNATGIDANDYDMMNDDNVALFWENEGCCGSTPGQNEDLGFCKTLGFWSSKTPFMPYC